MHFTFNVKLSSIPIKINASDICMITSYYETISIFSKGNKARHTNVHNTYHL